MNKTYIYKVYNAGATLWDVGVWDIDTWDFSYEFVTTWDAVWEEEVVSLPTFSSSVNGGFGALYVKLARDWTNYGENYDVKLGNRVVCWVADKEYPNGQILYAGFINSYSPIIENGKQLVEVEIWGESARLEDYILEDSSGNTTLTYNSQDPSDIVRDIIDIYRDLGGDLNYTASSVVDTGTTVSYTFSVNTVREALDKAVELAPDNWYWVIGNDNMLYFRQSSDTVADHRLTVGTQIKNARITKSRDSIVNQVYLVGGTPPASPQIYKKTVNSGSSSAYGVRSQRYIDERITTDGTATLISDRILSRQSSPKTIVQIEVIDNNGVEDGLGYDIESISPGDSIKILGVDFAGSTVTYWDKATWDTDVWDFTIQESASQVLQVITTNYQRNILTINAGLELPAVNKRVEDIYRNLTDSMTVDAPNAPS